MHKRTNATAPRSFEDVESEVQPPGDGLPETERHARELAQGVISEKRLDAGLTNIPH
ncbi:MAG: hypothetical protein JWR52_3498 [Marmoricola sp.]|nr:hypothetical protein [Marmoricola sp.]